MSVAITGLAEVDVQAAVVWGAVVIVLILLGGAGVLLLRRRLLGGGSHDDKGGFASLEELRRQGLVTDEELRAIRRKTMERHEARERARDKPDPARENLTPGGDLSDSKIDDTEGAEDAPPKD